MSINRYTYLLVGIRLYANNLPFDKWDDALLPYIEGHKGVEISIHDGEDSDWVYVGKVIAKSDPYSDELSQVITLPDFSEVAWLITEAIGRKNPNVELWMFDHYH